MVSFTASDAGVRRISDTFGASFSTSITCFYRPFEDFKLGLMQPHECI